MPNPYNHFLKLNLNDTDIKQLNDAFYDKKPQEMNRSLLTLKLNEEDLKDLEDAFYGKNPKDAEPEEHLKTRKNDSIKDLGNDCETSPKKRKRSGSEHYKQMQKHMFKWDLGITVNQEEFEKKNKEEPPVSADQNMFRLNSKTGNVTPNPKHKRTNGPQHRYIFRFNSNTGKLTEPKVEQESSSCSPHKP